METVMSETELLQYVLNELKEIRADIKAVIARLDASIAEQRRDCDRYRTQYARDIESLRIDQVALATKFSGLVAVISTVVSIIVSAAVYAVRRMLE